MEILCGRIAAEWLDEHLLRTAASLNSPIMSRAVNTPDALITPTNQLVILSAIQ